MIFLSITAVFLYFGVVIMAFSAGAQYREGNDPEGYTLIFTFVIFIFAAAVHLGALFI